MKSVFIIIKIIIHVNQKNVQLEEKDTLDYLNDCSVNQIRNGENK